MDSRDAGRILLGFSALILSEFRHVDELCDESEREKQNRGVDGQHDNVFDHARGQDRHKGIAVQDGKPQGVQSAVYDRLCQEFRDENAPDPDGLFVQDRAIDHACDHDIERVTKEKGAAVRFQHVFQDIKRGAEDRADPRAKQVFRDAVWQAGKADADIGRDKDGSGVVEYDGQCRQQTTKDKIVCDFQLLEHKKQPPLCSCLRLHK